VVRLPRPAARRDRRCLTCPPHCSTAATCKPRCARFNETVDVRRISGNSHVTFTEGEIVALLGTADHLDWYCHVVMCEDGTTYRIGAGILDMHATRIEGP
jgi:hypothetical protein